MKPPAMRTPETDDKEIRALNARLAWVSTAGDLTGWLALFHDDMVLMPPLSASKPVLFGKEALRAWAQSVFELFRIDETIATEEVQVLEELGFTCGTYRSSATPKAGGEPHPVSGRFMFVVRRLPDGSWKYMRGIWNSDLPDTQPSSE